MRLVFVFFTFFLLSVMGDVVDTRSLWSMFIKLVIGLVLLFFCWNYLQDHPAEKEAITSGFDILLERVDVWWDGLF